MPPPRFPFARVDEQWRTVSFAHALDPVYGPNVTVHVTMSRMLAGGFATADAVDLTTERDARLLDRYRTRAEELSN
jgi:hypothetical protein